MQIKFPNIIGVLLAFILMAEMVVAQPPLTHGLTALKIPRMAPSMQLEDMDEALVDLATFRGKVVVVNFWATWCPPCRREMGSLERLYLETKEQNVVVLAVNIGEDMDVVFPFLGDIEPSPSFPVLFDKEAVTMSQWKVMGLPTTFVIGPDGSIVYRAVGGREFDHPDLVKKVVDLHP